MTSLKKNIRKFNFNKILAIYGRKTNLIWPKKNTFSFQYILMKTIGICFVSKVLINYIDVIIIDIKIENRHN